VSDRRGEPFDVCSSERHRRRERVDRCVPERLGRVDVAQAGEDALVEE
jgi:hypothetical protein